MPRRHRRRDMGEGTARRRPDPPPKCALATKSRKMSSIARACAPPAGRGEPEGAAGRLGGGGRRHLSGEPIDGFRFGLFCGLSVSSESPPLEREALISVAAPLASGPGRSSKAPRQPQAIG